MQSVRKIVQTPFEVAGLRSYDPHAFRLMLARHTAKNSTNVAQFIINAQDLGPRSR